MGEVWVGEGGGRETERQRETERERETDRERQTERERETDRERQTERDVKPPALPKFHFFTMILSEVATTIAFVLSQRF